MDNGLQPNGMTNQSDQTGVPVVLITGGATGVGRACALHFARHGFDVVLNYHQSDQAAATVISEIEQIGRRAIAISCDVSDDSAVRSMVSSIHDHWGRLDSLINNAACTYFIEHENLEALTEAMWDRILAVNLKGVFFVTRAAVPLLQRSPDPSIVNVSSVAGIAGVGSSIAYCASKGALNTMTKSLARALAPIRVNSVCPGPIDTDWLRGWKSETEIRQATAHFAIPRPSQPEEIAEAVWFLSRRASMTTGHCLVVDGGQLL